MKLNISCSIQVKEIIHYLTSIGRKTMLILVVLPVMFLSSCDKDDDTETELVEGVVRFTGSPASDGCGWLVVINNVSYLPENLPEDFQKDEEQAVLLSYKRLDEKSSCGFASLSSPKLHVIRIKEIKLK